MVLILLAACSGGGDSGRARTSSRDTLTERQRDSMLAKSRIPGARGVGRAMSASDSINARVRAADSVSF